MKLKIAGGCGEHGRNCFLVDTGTQSFLIDCGIMQGSDKPFPRLTKEEIQPLKYVFLTHSHADHSGAIPWLYENGFSGAIIASAPTLEQLPFSVKNAVSLEELFGENHGKIGSIELEYGRAGHCVGSVWYRFCAEGKSALFSGDYFEGSPIYACDNIRNKTADVAVLDCAYGKDTRCFTEYCHELVLEVEQLKKTHPQLIFPVPKYGRGIELLKLFCEKMPKLVCCGDKHFITQLNEITDKKHWYKSFDVSAMTYKLGCNCDILFLSDPQLCSEESRSITENLLSQGGFAVMTGTVEHGSFSERLIQRGKMQLLRYPVHQNFSEYKALAENNNFRCTIPYHTEDFCCEGEIILFGAEFDTVCV